jgi:hypothetical protein
MAHQVYPGGHRRVRIPELARDLVTGEWQRAQGRAGGLSMSASTVGRYRDLLVRLDVIRRVPWGTRGTHRNGKRFGDRFTYGRQFRSLFGRGRFSRAGLMVWLVRAMLVRAFGVESVPMTSFVLRTSLVSNRRTVEKVPAAPADVGLSPPKGRIAAGNPGADPESRQDGLTRALESLSTVNEGGNAAPVRLRMLYKGELVYCEAFTCAYCGGVGVAPREAHRKFCSASCRTLAWRRRRREKLVTAANCTDG